MARVNRAVIELAAKDSTRQAFASVKGNFKDLQGQVDAIGSRFGALQTTIVTALTGFGLGTLLTGVADQLDAFNDLSDATGASIASLSKLDAAARRTGGTLEDVGELLGKFNQALLRAKPGSDQAAAFEALGLSVAELRKQDPAEALLTTAQAFQRFAGDGEAARAQTLLLGESVKRLAPLLKDLAENSGELGVVTEQQADAADQFNKAMARVRSTAQDLARTAVADLLPVITETLRSFQAGEARARGFAESGGVLRTAFEALVITAANVEFVFGAIGREIGALAAQLVALGRLDLDGFNAISEAVKEDGRRARAELDAFEQRILSAGRAAADQAGSKLLDQKLPALEIKFRDPKAESAARKAADEAKKLAEQQRLINELLADSGPAFDRYIRQLGVTAPAAEELGLVLKDVRTPQEELAEGFDKIQRAAMAVDFGEPMKEMEALQRRTEHFLDRVQDGFGETLYRTLKGDFDNIFELWSDLLLRMIAEAAAADFARALGFSSANSTSSNNLTQLLNNVVGVFTGPGRASGGPVRRGGLYPINELGGPGEVLNSGGRQFLLAGQDGYVTPGRSAPLAAAGPVTVNQIRIETPPGTRAETSERPNASGGLDTLIRIVDERMAAGFASGGSQSARALQNTYGLSRGAGAPRRG